MSKIPFVTGILVVYNEESYIEKSLESLLMQNYDTDFYEVLVIDGISTDKTVDIVKKTYEKYLENGGKVKFSIFSNNRKTLASGWNLGISESLGEYIFRIDGHSYIERDFINKTLSKLVPNKDIACVGGLLSTVNNDQKTAISMVLSSPFGIGNSKFRYSRKSGYVDTVAFGMYRKAIFTEVGLFNEKLKRNQDLDLHSRIRKLGMKFYLDTNIEVYYFSRINIKSFLKQGYQNGFWNIILFKINKNSLSIRHLVPFVFVSTLLILIILSFFNIHVLYLLFATLTLYLFTGVIFSLLKTRNVLTIIKMMYIFFLLHLCYGFGSLVGFIHKKK